MSLLENIADSKIKQFGTNLGLNCFIPKRETVAEPLFQLCVVHADRLEAVHYDMFGETHPQGTKQELVARAIEEEAQGYNTYLFEFGGKSDGYFNKNFLKDQYQTLEVVFHEGFHQRARKSRIHDWIEESAAKVVGLEASLSFFKKFGNEDDCQTVERTIQSTTRTAIQFKQQLNQRLEELTTGKSCPTIHPYNNARIYGEYPYYGHFAVCHNVFKRMSTFRGFVELISGLPREIEKCQKILNAIQKY